MATVTFVGVKGSGKTTAARRLAESSSGQMRYLYMGLNSESANVALPTTRIARSLKRRARKVRVAPAHDGAPHEGARVPEAMANLVDTRGRTLAALRLLNRLAEQIFRRVLSALYQVRGYTVIYDRHAYFETAHGARPEARFSDRALRRLSNALFSKPRFVVFLDAEPGALVGRSGGVCPDVLRRRREQLVDQLGGIQEVVTIDASQPPEAVIETVRQAVSRAGRAPRPRS